jgi:hypothetical protein
LSAYPAEKRDNKSISPNLRMENATIIFRKPKRK